jgi:phosphatidylserine/phosphatidylglycerophosphate/cardiolipin synthase-like enzyme
LRETVFRRLLASDRYRRLRLVYPVTSRSADVCTFIHSKLMSADDDVLRIGSANLSSRSLGMDTECDLTVVAGGRDDVRAGITTIQARLLAEHLGLDTEYVIQETQRLGSLRALIDSRSDADRTLARIELSVEDAPAVDTAKVVQTAADPAEPIAFASLWSRVMGLVMRRLAPAAAGHQRRTEFV